MKKLVIIGAGGHGKVVADLALLNGYEKIVFRADLGGATECAGFPVEGTTDDLSGRRDWDFFVAIGDSAAREKYFKKLEGFNIVTLIHPNATVARGAQIGRGTAVMAGAVVCTYAKVGDGCIVNTCASVDHESVVGDFSHISVGAHLSGGVNVGRSVWVGVGAAVVDKVSICDCCVVGAGAVVTKNLDARGTYIGVPAKLYERKS